MTSTELKLDSQSSALPRAGRSGKSLPLSAAANVPSSSLSGCPNQQTDTVAAASEMPSIAGKRRSAAQSYRMQTESSLAKMTAGKELSAESSSIKSNVNRKESYTMMRFPSTPDIAANAQEVDSHVELAKDSQRVGLMEDANESQRLRMDGYCKADSSGGAVSVNANDRALMPPPLSTTVPSSYQATFIAKAAKHRRTTMPESLGRSRELLAGAIAKHHRLSDSSATDGDDSPPSSVSAGMSTLQQTLDTSPVEPPERDVGKTQGQIGGVQSSHNVSNAEYTSVTGMKADHSDSVSSTGSSVTGNPTIVKIGRCVSPMRPHSASNISHRRQLPPDPRSCVSVTHGSVEYTTASDLVTSCTLPLQSVPRSASVESGMRSVESAQDVAVSQSASAGRLSTGSSTDVPKQQASQVQQGGQRPISSKTQTRLVLNSEDDKSESLLCTAQQTIINEIERFCTERRTLGDQPSQFEVLEGTDHKEQFTADSRTLAAFDGHTRQPWGKTKPLKPLVIGSPSNSSVSQTPSSTACDSLALADVSSVSSGSCMTYNVSGVIASVSDSIISYDSTVHLPAAALGATETDTSLQVQHSLSDVATDSEASEDKHMSVVVSPLRNAESSEKPLSAMSSDK